MYHWPDTNCVGLSHATLCGWTMLVKRSCSEPLSPISECRETWDNLCLKATSNCDHSVTVVEAGRRRRRPPCMILRCGARLSDMVTMLPGVVSTMWDGSLSQTASDSVSHTVRLRQRRELIKRVRKSM